MCVVSMISDHYMQRFPMPGDFPPFVWPDYQELLRKAKAYDELTKQADCPAPEKVQWARELERVMREKYGLVPWGQPDPASKAACKPHEASGSDEKGEGT